jgi:hypothetical protein
MSAVMVAVTFGHDTRPARLKVNDDLNRRRRGSRSSAFRTLLQHGERLGCGQAWVLTDDANTAAMRLYASVGGTADPAVMLTFTLAPPRT